MEGSRRAVERSARAVAGSDVSRRRGGIGRFAPWRDRGFSTRRGGISTRRGGIRTFRFVEGSRVQLQHSSSKKFPNARTMIS